MADDLTRRTFLNTTGLAAAGAAIGTIAHPAIRTGHAAHVPPSEKLRVALIGCGGMGNGDLDDFMRADEVIVTGLCDVDERHLNRTAEKVERKYGTKPALLGKDFRAITDSPDVDAVIIGTPDHWHAIPFIIACLSGKDVYCEKPISHNIVEGRAMVSAAHKFQRVSQIGTQQRSGEHFQKAVEIVRSGKLGRISMTRTWNFSNESPDGFGRPADQDGAPEGVDYDRWLGPAPARKFNPERFHGTFRWFFDYAAGMVGDWNVHLQDIIHWAMDVTAPKSVHASGGKYTVEDLRDTPDTLLVTYEFDGKQGPFLQVYEMRKGNARGLGGDSGHGMQFHGTEGTLYLDRGGFEVFPESEGRRGERKDRMAAIRSGGSDQHWPHVQNFLACVKSRDRCICDVETGHTSTVVCHLANISYKLNRKIYWDAAKEQVTFQDGRPDPEANALLGREYRKGYELPSVS